MRKLFALLFAVIVLAIGVSAAEIVVYENDFSEDDLSFLRMYGSMQIVNGGLKAVGSGTSAYVAYDLPEEYKGMDYRVDVDIRDNTAMAGVLVGATSDTLKQEPSYFSGYVATTTGSGTIYHAFFNETGWGGTFAPNSDPIPRDFHLSVTVYKGASTLRVTSLEDGSLIYESRYEPGDGEGDIYKTFTSTTGLRQYYSDVGYFDNFKVTVLVDDKLPTMSTGLTFGDTAFKTSGITVSDGVATGTGAMLPEKALTGEYRIKASLANENISRVYFGMKDALNGYTVEFNEEAQDMTLFKIVDGKFEILQKRRTAVRNGFTDVIVDVHDGMATIIYDNYFEGEKSLPKMELYLDNTDGKFGYWLEGGKLSGVTNGASTVTLAEATYTNAVNFGADPDMLFYEGTYYLYTYEGNDGNSIFRVYTSPDLANFTPRNFIFEWDHVNYSNVNGKTAWSANVFYNESDGLFYLTFAAEQMGADTTRRVYYASSDSPLGPFVHDGPLVPINPDHTEIDGHAFVGYDGKTYMSFSRYDKGGTVWVEEVTIKDGKIIAKPETAQRAVYPDKPWDNDGAVRLCEGGFVWKHDGYYYMIYATGSYSRHYGEALAISKSPLGPYEKIELNPILNWNYIIDGPGDALMINSPDGEETYMIYHRHTKMNFEGGTREVCVDLVEFVENPDDPTGPDLLVLRGPTSTPQKLPSNKYRYDVNRDGAVTLADAMMVLGKVRSNDLYSGYYDVDANGSLGINDVMTIFEMIK
ncbi:MAG: family 43 glycosylhydrolase [Clostridia bacterium]|nr:family 43 glycosylhydrolase [Clostridia bacterium]